MKLEHQYADLGEVRLHYVRAGDPAGRKVLLVHGWPETWYAWRHVIDELVEADGFDVVAPDLRGLGDSSRSADGYDKWTIAADLFRLVQSLWPTQPVLVAGHDWGGVVAFDLAVQLGQQTAGLAVLDVTIPVEVDDGAVDFSQGGRRWHHAFHQTPDLPEQLIAGREREYYTWFYTHFAAQGFAGLDAAVIDEYLRCYGSATGTRAGLAYYRALPEDRRRHTELPRPTLEVPVLAIGGDSGAGRGLEPGLSLQGFADDVTGEVISNCGHWLMEEQPAAVTRLLEAFADRVHAGAG
jgi:pimeloyl-ACP methyl ester carboxylesterase